MQKNSIDNLERKKERQKRKKVQKERNKKKKRIKSTELPLDTIDSRLVLL